MGALGLNLFIALALLAPGVAVHAAIFGGRRTLIRAAPPAPNSMAALGVVVFGAIAAHALAASGFLLDDVAARKIGGGLALPFDPDPYRVALQASARRLGAGELDELLLTLLALSAAAYLATTSALKLAAVEAWAAPRLYGWAGALPFGGGGRRLVTAFIVTDGEMADHQIGYEGAVRDLGLTSEKALASVLLFEASTFHMELADGRVQRVPTSRERIPWLLIEGARIRNVAFDVFEVPDASQATADPASAPP